jgi:hypothetical protein
VRKRAKVRKRVSRLRTLNTGMQVVVPLKVKQSSRSKVRKVRKCARSPLAHVHYPDIG